MVDDKFEVHVRGLVLGVPVTLHALHHSEDGDFWEGFGHYVSDETGTVTGACTLWLLHKLLQVVCSR